MNDYQITISPLLLAGPLALALLLLAALHISWGLGGLWPGHDAESLAQKVVGGPAGMKPPPNWACFGVAAALAVAAGLVLASVGVLALPLPVFWVKWSLAALAAILLLRGIGGFFMERLRPSIVGSPFVRLNRLIYSPLCVVLGLMALGLVLTWVAG